MPDTFNLPMFDCSESQEDFWMRQDGKEFVVEGIKYRLRVSAYTAQYPYHHRALHVDAYPVNKRTKFYRDMKLALGDDWGTDVLKSFDFECEILAQIALLEVA